MTGNRRLGAPRSVAVKCATGHRVDASITSEGHIPGDTLRLKGGMWEVQIAEPEVVRLRDWLLANYPLQRPLPSPKPPAVIVSQEKAARAAAWGKRQDALLRRIVLGDLSRLDQVDWQNVMRAVRRVSGLEGKQD